MRRAVPIVLLVAVSSLAQSDRDGAEEAHLRQLLVEAGSSSLEFIRAAEKHLARFPGSSRKSELERSLARAAIDANDAERIVLYGERVLAREDDPQILEGVTRALLSGDTGGDKAERALAYAERFEKLVRSLEKEKPQSPRALARWSREIERGLAGALLYKAQATGRLGRLDEALALARQSYQTYPNAESAREIGNWLARSGDHEEAIHHFADAFVISDDSASDEARAQDRAHMGELYRKLYGSETGLGDLILKAYDRTRALLEERRARLRQLDPNAGLTDPMEFTLSGFGGDQLRLSSLRGNVLVFDFWATWCAPCRVQHPLYEAVKERFKNRSDLLFLSINTDQERRLVGPFLDENGWSRKVYFEDGLARLLDISSIPTTIVTDKRGEIAARLVGFDPDRFVDMLTERIQEALGR